MAAIVVGLVVVLRSASRLTDVWPNFRNPFGEQSTDRSQPALLKSIQDLSRYVAAEGNFQVVVDTQNNRENVPDFLLNERTLFVGAGSVEAYVDFATIGEGAIVESADGTSVEIKLPAPQLGDVDLDMENSYVFAEERGLSTGSASSSTVTPTGSSRSTSWPRTRSRPPPGTAGSQQRAEENTRKMLEGLLRSLGYTIVTVTYTAP